MSIDFPNNSRSFDETRNAVRFIGYDGMSSVPFFVEAAALAKSAGKQAVVTSEADCLAAFDAARVSIHDIAREAYANSRRSSYVLTVSDFR